MKFLKISLSMALMAFMLLPQSVEAENVFKSSFLCKNKNLFYTMVGFSTKDFDVAICKDNEPEGNLYYIGQDKETKATMFLPAIKENDPYGSQKNYWTAKARNGEYTYQVSGFFTPSDQTYITHASLSVFKNGKKIYHAISKNTISSWP